MISAILYGRGGQGVDSATRILGRASFLSKFTVQDFTVSEIERRGFPVLGNVKMDKNEIISRQVEPADFLLVFDKTLNIGDILKLAKESFVIIFNSSDKVNFSSKKKSKAYRVNATDIAMNTLKKPYPNIVMLGALLKVFPGISLKCMKNALDSEPIDKENMLALEEGMKNIKKNEVKK